MPATMKVSPARTPKYLGRRRRRNERNQRGRGSDEERRGGKQRGKRRERISGFLYCRRLHSLEPHLSRQRRKEVREQERSKKRVNREAPVHRSLRGGRQRQERVAGAEGGGEGAGEGGAGCVEEVAGEGRGEGAGCGDEGELEGEEVLERGGGGRGKVRGRNTRGEQARRGDNVARGPPSSLLVFSRSPAAPPPKSPRPPFSIPPSPRRSSPRTSRPRRRQSASSTRPT